MRWRGTFTHCVGFPFMGHNMWLNNMSPYIETWGSFISRTFLCLDGWSESFLLPHCVLIFSFSTKITTLRSKPEPCLSLNKLLHVLFYTPDVLEVNIKNTRMA